MVSVYLFPNLEAALKGVFNRVRIFFRTRANTPFRLKRVFQRTLQLMSSSTTTPGAPSVPPWPSPDSRSSCDGLRPKPWHDRSPRRTATYQPALRVKFAMKVRKRAQQRWSGLRLCALSSKCVPPSVMHCVCHCGPTLSRIPTRATWTPSYVPSVALFFVALIGLYHEPSTLPHCPFAL